MAKYKIVAHLIDPSLQDEETLTDEYLRDWEIIERGGKQAMKLLYKKYPIDSNTCENFNSTDKYILEQDGDGIYLFKRCDDMTESKFNKQTIKLNESQLRKIVTECTKQVLKEGFFNVPGNNVAEMAKLPSDVFKMNNWVYRTESKGNGELVLQCFTNNNSLRALSYPSFDKVLSDLRKYYELHNSTTQVEEIEGPSDRGVFIKLTKRQ